MANSMTSLWSQTASQPVSLSALDQSVTADVAIIGAGYTGLSTALHLAEKGVKVCVLEAEQPGWGASGRNGGQVNPTLKYDPQQLISLFGMEKGEQLIDTLTASGDLVFSLIEKNQIPCDPVRNGWMQVSYSEKGVAALHQRAKQWADRGVGVSILDAESLQARTGTQMFAGGWLDKRAGSVQPLSYVRGLVNAALQAGASIYERTRVTGLAKDAQQWLLNTSTGATVRADKVLFATNGYSDQLWPGMAQSILAANSFVIATEPLPPTLADSILAGKETVSTAQRLLLYFRKDAEGRLVMGGRGSFNDPHRPADFAHLEKSLALLYPQLKGIGFQYRWCGKVAITRDFLPHIHEPAPGITLSLGCNGRGIALCTSLGKHLAERLYDPRYHFPYPVTELKKIPGHGLQRFYIGAGVAWYSLLDRLNFSH